MRKRPTASVQCGPAAPYRPTSLRFLAGRTPYEFHAQGGQDAWLLFNVFGGRARGRNFSFIDIGCNDGITGSNTWHLSQSQGWSGVCMEADPNTFKKIRNRSGRSDGVNLAVSNSSGPLRFTRISDPVGGLSGLSATLGPPRGSFRRSSITVSAISPRQLLRRYFGHQATIDYVSVDVEGAELSILRAWPFEDGPCVSALSVENNQWCNTRTILPALRRLLEPRGYVYRRRIWMDEIFVRGPMCEPDRPIGATWPERLLVASEHLMGWATLAGGVLSGAACLVRRSYSAT